MNDKIIEILFNLWKYDIEVFSQPWMYYWLCIPAATYLAFFFIKWSVLTAPIWLPISIIIKSFRK